MKKTMLLAAVAALSLGFAPSHAELGNGCVAGPLAPDIASVCDYTSTGVATQYVVATPNTWEITVVRDNEKVVLAEGELGLPSTGTIAALNGEKVTVTMGPDCAQDPVCGSVGIIAVLETA